MKAHTMIASLMMIAGLGFNAAAADHSTAKAATRIDFNRMIEDNNNTRTELKKDIDGKAEVAAQADESERSNVVDFVDVEVGWGESAPVVDRRFDSIGEAKPYIMNESSLETPAHGS